MRTLLTDRRVPSRQLFASAPVLALVGLVAGAACGASGASGTSGVDGGTTAPDARKAPTDAGKSIIDAPTALTDAGADHQSAPPDAATDAATVDAHTDDGGQSDASVPDGGVPDPNLPGPYGYAQLDDTMNVAASGDNGVAIHCAYPTSGPSAGPYPVIVFAHGDELPPSEYYGYLERLASFGYVALTVDFPTPLLTTDNPGDAEDLIAALDWTQSNATVAALANPALSGMTGHSLGGKEALLAATMDARIKASIVLDPVDAAGGMTCTAPDCVTVAPLLAALHIPTGFLGETTDGTGGVGGMPCAPVAENYATFYAQATSPSFEVTVANAGHMSFLDDLSSCGFVCQLCTAGTAPNSEVDGLAHAYVAAFFERYLRGNVAYDTYLTGPLAQARYVATSEATILSK